MGICEGDKNIKANKNNEKYIKDDKEKKQKEKIPFDEALEISQDKSEKISRQLKLYICKLFISDNGVFYGTGFLCKIPYLDKFNYVHVLITNNHVITKDQLLKKQKQIITFNDGKIKRILNITTKRNIYSNEDLDITIIEIFPEEDNLFYFFEVDDLDLINNKLNEFIYILQYPHGENVSIYSISYGKILKINFPFIYNNCNTKKGSSGGPILLLNNLKVIGLHQASLTKNEKIKQGILLKQPLEEFNLILQKKNQMITNKTINCIKCLYKIKDGEEFNLLHDYNEKITNFNNEFNQLYSEGKKKKIFLEKNINIYIDSDSGLKPIKFNFKYKPNKNQINEIKFNFIFKDKLDDLSFLFFNCKNLKTVDLSPFNGIDIINLNNIFNGCQSLESIDFFLFNTNNVINMSGMFNNCNSLKLINLSSFDTSKVINMSKMFSGCSSLKKIDLSGFNTINVTNMREMFANCYSLKYLYISSFQTKNVRNMKRLFSKCSYLKSLDLSSFDTTNVIDMSEMFDYCSTLENLDLSSFNTINVENMELMFASCQSIKSIDLSSFNTINVKNMTGMFTGDFMLGFLDLSLFNSKNVEKNKQMFAGCFLLRNLKCKDEKILNLFSTAKYADKVVLNNFFENET